MTDLTTPQEEKISFLSRPIAAGLSLDWEKAIYIAFIIFAIVTRFTDLGGRVMSHDESLHTQFSYQYYNGDGYVHTPLMHGPFLFHATALSYWLFGPGDFSARLPVAILGVLLVLMPYFLRTWLGRVGAIFTSFFFLISPYLTYYSRYIRHDIYIIIWAMIIVIAMWYYFRERKERYLYWFAGATALMFATKEVAFLYVAIFGSFLIWRLFAQMLTAPWFRKQRGKLFMPILIVALGVVLALGSAVGEKVVEWVSEAMTSAETTTEALATETPAETDEAGGMLGWVTVAGIGIAALGLFLAARSLRPFIDDYPEFDFIILFTTLLLPFVAPMFSILVGWDPLDYNFNSCVLQGQESMSAVQLSLGKLTNIDCWSAGLSSGIIRSFYMVLITIVIGIAVGLWWNARKWITAAIIFSAIIIVFYTSFFTNPGGWATGVVGSLGYWMVQQGVQRGSQPWFYYFFVTPFYEFLVAIFSIAGIYLWAKRHQISESVFHWVWTIVLAGLGFSLVNWFYQNTLDPIARQDASKLPGFAMALAIVVVSTIFWFAFRRGRVKEHHNVKGIKDLFSTSYLLEFVPFLIWWLLLTILAYSYAGEKMPWLSTHFVIPMAMLSGWYFGKKLSGLDVGTLFSRRAVVLLGLSVVTIVALFLAIGPLLLGKVQFGNQSANNLANMGQFLGGLLVAGILGYFWWQQYRKVGPGALRSAVNALTAFILLSLLTIRFMYMSSFSNADYTTEFMVYAHGAPATKNVVMEQIDELSMRLEGDKTMSVAFDSDVSWPFTWYLRDYPNRNFYGENPGQNLNDSPVVLVGSANYDKVAPYLGDNYSMTEHTFLWWPMEQYRQISWNALWGDPDTPEDLRRGIFNADVRQALWDIFIYRDYQKYGEVFGGTYTAGEWPLRHDMRLYIRNDVTPTMWDYGIGAVAAGGGGGVSADPYAEGEFIVNSALVLNESGIPGSNLGDLSAPRNLAVAPDGTIFVADSGNNRVQVFDANGIPVTTFGAFGEQEGLFNEPWGIAADAEFVYVADTWNHRIQKFTHTGEFVDVFGSSGSVTDPAEGGLGLFFGPRSIILYGEDQLLVTDTGNHRIQILDRNGNFLSQLGGFGSNLGQMNEPVGLSEGPDGQIFLADTWNSRVQAFSPDMVPMNAWSVNAWNGTSINNKPYSAVDSGGRIYVTDPEGYRVIIFNPDGSYLGRFGAFGTEAGKFGLPNGIFIDAQDFVYIADAGNNRILKFAPLFTTAQQIEEAPVDGGVNDAVMDENVPAEESDESADELINQEEILPTPTEE